MGKHTGQKIAFTGFLVILNLFVFSYTSVAESGNKRGVFSVDEMLPEGPQQLLQEPAYAPGEILVKFKEGVDPAAVLKRAKLNVQDRKRLYSITPAVTKYKKTCKLDKSSDGWYWFLGEKYKEVDAISEEKIFTEAYKQMDKNEQGLYRTYVVKLPEGTSVPDALRALVGTKGIDYAEPNYIVKILSVPNDPYYHSSGAWGQAYPDLWGLKKVAAERAWDLPAGQGEGVVVAVIDTGVDYTHEDLAANMWQDAAGHYGYDFMNDDADPMDDNGHGTHCAGTIAAVADNGIGIAGVAPKAKIMAVKGLNGAGSGPLDVLANCVKYAVDNGAHILSNSWGGSGSVNILIDAFVYAYQRGVTVVAAAGNATQDVAGISPANIATVIAVAATDHEDVKSDFSNYGLKIDITAPGGGSVIDDGPDGPDTWRLGRDILSLRAHGTDLYAPADVSRGLPAGICFVPQFAPEAKYYRSRGTSMACPHAAGVAALIKGMYPLSAPDEIRIRLTAGAENIDALNPEWAGRLGTGRVNAYNSLTVTPRPILRLCTVVGEDIYPGKRGIVRLSLINVWQDVAAVIATLTTEDPLVAIDTPVRSLGDIRQGQTVAFEFPNVRIDSSASTTATIDFSLTLNGAGGYAARFPFRIAITYFADVGPLTGLPLDLGVPTHSQMCDYDNDGYADLIFNDIKLGIGNRALLNRNLGDGRFRMVNDEAGISLDPLNAQEEVVQSLFLDINNDGNKDLLLVGMNGESAHLFLNLGNAIFADIAASSGIVGGIDPFNHLIALDYDADGFLDIQWGAGFWRNNGNNTFSQRNDIISCTGIANAVSFDYDFDGDMDLFGPHLYRNSGDGTFSELPDAEVFDQPFEVGQYEGSAAGDFNNDGAIDLLVSCQNKLHLFKNNGNGTFTEVTQDAGDLSLVGVVGWKWGTEFFDYDNDGYLDILCTDGGTGRIKWPLALYRNNGDGTFSFATGAFPELGIKSVVASIGDYDSDGDLDIHCPALKTQSAFFKNLVGSGNNWIKFKLEGTTTNREAIGARVYVKTGEIRQVRELHTSAVELQPVHFGIGKATAVDEVEVVWPNGTSQKLNNLGANQIVSLRQDEYAPFITALSRTPMPETTFRVSLTGRNFGTRTGDDPQKYIQLYDSLQAQIISWSDTSIIFDVSGVTQSGHLRVVTEKGISNPIYLSVLPPPPLNLQAVGSFEHITLSWTVQSNEATGFTVERSATPSGAFTPIGTTTTTTYLDTPPLRNQTYYYRVAAYNQHGSFGYSNVASAQLTPPQAPYLEQATVLEYGRVELQLRDTGTGRRVVMLQRGTPGSGVFEIIEGILFDDNTTMPATYIDTVHKNGTYNYRAYVIQDSVFSGYSNIVSVDVTSASPIAVTLYANHTAVREGLKASWFCGGFPASFIKEYFYIVTEGSPSDTVVRDWTSAGTDTSVLITGLSLETGKTYYVGVKADTLIGGMLPTGFSSGLTIEGNSVGFLSPALNTSFAEAPVTITTTHFLNELEATHARTIGFIVSFDNRQVLGYDLVTGQLFSQDGMGGPSGGYPPGSNNRITGQFATLDCSRTTVTRTSDRIIIQWGITHHLYMRGIGPPEDHVGFLMVDNLMAGHDPPVLDAFWRVSPDRTAPTGAISINDFATATSSSEVILTLSATDNESGMSDGAQMQFSNDNLNWSAPERYVVSKSWTLLPADGRKSVWVKFKDNAGNWSVPYEDTIILDTTPAVMPEVWDEGATTARSDQLSARWSSRDDESGIAEYQYCLTQSSPTGRIVKEWISAGTATSLTLTGLNLENGEAYYIGVRARNGAGMFSQAGYSDGITVLRLPAAPVNLAAVAGSSSISLSWTDASDNEDGFSLQRQAPGDTSFVQLARLPMNTSSYTDTDVLPAATYIYRLQAFNAAGESAVSNQAYAQVVNVAPRLVNVLRPANDPICDTPYVITTIFSDTNGYRDLNRMYLLINTTIASGNACYAYYDQAQNKLYLFNNGTWTGGYAPGADGVIENGVCRLYCASTSVSASGNTLTINWRVSFKPSFTGTKSIYLYAFDKAMAYTNWQQRGTINISLPNVAPVVVAATPNSGVFTAGQSYTFSTTFADQNGYSDLNRMYLLINTGIFSGNACYAYYDQAQNKVYLFNNGVWSGGYTPGSGTVIENGVCRLYCAGTRVSGAGNNLTINWQVSFKPNFVGPKAIYLYAFDKKMAYTNWQQKGVISIK